MSPILSPRRGLPADRRVRRRLPSLTLLGVATATVIALLSGCDGGSITAPQTGPDPQLPEARRGLLPTMKIADPGAWGDRLPTVPDGFAVSAVATELKIPRQMLVLPNGDLLVAEGRGGHAPALKPKDLVAGVIKARGTSDVKGGNRLTLLRDADGDGRYEGRWVFAENLDAPYGLALIGNRLFVANQDALVRFDYEPGQTRAAAAPVVVTPLPSRINHHWTKSLTASADGRFLYVGIGSNSNVGERGMDVEQSRAQVWEIDATTGASRVLADGVRNPTALSVEPRTKQLWMVVNERDELGDDLVPDYLTAVRDGGFYGWPYAYWGANEDTRARPARPDLVAATLRPDYALPSHSAALGLAFADGVIADDRFRYGAVVGMHGSWNRGVPAGYKVVFVPFTDGKPSGAPIDLLTGFQVEGKTLGRPVGVAVSPRGDVFVADDLSNTIWRVGQR